MTPQGSESACDTCHTPESQLSKPLKVCAKCKTQRYCSRECQKAAWKTHKKSCTSSAAVPNSDTNIPKSSGTGPADEKGPCYITKPFTALYNGDWLSKRSKQDVFKLLVDIYRMRVEDQCMFEGVVEEGSLYSDADPAEALVCFRRFLTTATQLDQARSPTKKILPDWWSSSISIKECLEFAVTDDFSNVGYAIEKHDIKEHYKQFDMPMQLRMFGEMLDGYQVMGQPGAGMMELRMELEKNDKTVVSSFTSLAI